jgi:hypothetical protein
METDVLRLAPLLEAGVRRACFGVNLYKNTTGPTSEIRHLIFMVNSVAGTFGVHRDRWDRLQVCVNGM